MVFALLRGSLAPGSPCAKSARCRSALPITCVVRACAHERAALGKLDDQYAPWSTDLAASAGLAAAPGKGERMGYDAAGRRAKRPFCKDGNHSMLRFVIVLAI